MIPSLSLGHVRRFLLSPCVAAFFGASLFSAFALEIGDTPEAVQEEMGEPSGKGVIGNKQFWQYPRGQVVFQDGAVKSWRLETEEEYGRRIMEQRARAQAAARHQAEGEEMIANLRNNPNFAVATPDRQIEALRRFHARYPKVQINDLVQNAMAAKRMEQQAAAQAAAAAAAAVAQERELAALQERNRQLEIENARREEEIQQRRRFNEGTSFGVNRYGQGYNGIGGNTYYRYPPVIVLPGLQYTPPPAKEEPKKGHSGFVRTPRGVNSSAFPW